jgi:phosphoribosylformylglycinamidine synthase
LLVALAEMTFPNGIGAKLDAAPTDIPAHAHWFGEDQARYLVTVAASAADAVIAKGRAAGIPVSLIGTTGGDHLALAGERAIAVAALRERFEGWLPAYMAGEL